MSTKEMETMDNEVMGVVNKHATPAAEAAAEEILEKATTEEKFAEPPKPDRSEEFVCQLRKKEFDELAAKVETTQRCKTLTTVILCVLLAAALLVVLAVPKLLIWLVNIGVASCAVIVGIALDRWWRR